MVGIAGLIGSCASEGLSIRSVQNEDGPPTATKQADVEAAVYFHNGTEAFVISPPGYGQGDHVILYIPLPLPKVDIPPEIGEINDNPKDPLSKQGKKDIERIQGYFHRAYLEALLAGIPLAGVLGADRVHTWTQRTVKKSEISTLVQNWKSPVVQPNGFGLPNLLLAMYQEHKDVQKPQDTVGQVVLIGAPLLFAYSQAGGIGRAGALAGYGYPLAAPVVVSTGGSTVFALLCSQGLLTARWDSDGMVVYRFWEHQDPLPDLPIPPAVGQFANGDQDPVFGTSWRRALYSVWTAVLVSVMAQNVDLAGADSGSSMDVRERILRGQWGNPDGPVLRGKAFAVQTFDNTAWALVRNVPVVSETAEVSESTVAAASAEA
ncbi:MAG: hypothetical protein SNJ56_06770, partial [Termitinemataceae bacterium]